MPAAYLTSLLPSLHFIYLEQRQSRSSSKIAPSNTVAALQSEDDHDERETRQTSVVCNA